MTKIDYYELVKITINILSLAKIIINMVICHHNIFNSIVIDPDLLFISKFWSSLYYFLSIKKKLSIVFHLL